MEDITNTNKELTNTNKALNETVVKQENLMANLTNKIENLEGTIQEMRTANFSNKIENLEATIQEMNTTLRMLQNLQNGKFSVIFYLYFVEFLIQELMVVPYQPRGPLILTVPWGSSTPRVFKNVLVGHIESPTNGFKQIKWSIE